MAIDRLLQNSSLSPSEIKLMTVAHEEALHLLGIGDALGPLSQLVAHRIIDVSKVGISDPLILAKRAIRALGIPSAEQLSTDREVPHGVQQSDATATISFN